MGGRHGGIGRRAYGGAYRLGAVRRAGVAVAVAAGVLACCGMAQPALAAAPCCGNDQDGEPEPPAPSHGANHGLLIIDNSNADSWLEVDRTLNTLLESQGTAGSDHDGDGGDVALTRPDPAPSAPDCPEGDD